MKYALLLLCLIGSLSHIKAANITLNFTNAPAKPVRICKPVNGAYFPGNLQLQTPDAKNKCIVENDLAKAGIVQIYCGKLFYFYIKPGKNYTVNFNIDDTRQPFTFTGDDAAGQQAFNQISHPNFQGKAAAYMRKDTTLAGIKALINTDAAAEREPLTQLADQKKISPEFYQWAMLEIDHYYAAVMGLIIYDSQARPGFVDEWPKLFGKYNLNNEAATSTISFHDYADQYASWYKTSYFRKLAGNMKRFDMRKSNEYLIDWYHRYADNLSGTTREYMLARFFNQFVNMKKYEPELVDLFNDFNKLYPNSRYLPYIQPGINEIIAYRVKTNIPAASGVQYLEDYEQLETVNDLLARFKNQTVYVDIWATWCGPCKEEFAFAPDLHLYLQSKNIKMLYVSTDVDERNADWKQMATNYNLNGLHLRTNSKLLQDMVKQLWKGSKGYSIPRYLLIKNGEIVIADALRPSDKEKLHEQIERYL